MTLYAVDVKFIGATFKESQNGGYYMAHFQQTDEDIFSTYVGKQIPSKLEKGKIYTLDFEYDEKYQKLRLVGVC